MKKKFALLVLVMCVAISGFTGCGGNGTSKNTENQNTQGKQDSETDTLDEEEDVYFEEEEIVPVARPVSMVYKTEDVVETYSYDSDGDVIGIEQNSIASGSVSTKTYEYLLDENGNKVKGYNDMYPFTYNLTDNLDLLASYRNKSLLIKKTESSSYDIGTYVYTYDENNRLIKESITQNHGDDYTTNQETVYYWADDAVEWTDVLDVQHTLEFDEYGFIEHYMTNSATYDGNIRRGAYQYNAKKQLTSFGEKTTRQYPGEEEMPINESLWEFAYDSNGNLISYKCDDDIDITYEYDNTGKLMKQSVKKYGWNEITYTREYIYEADKLLSIEVNGQKEWEFSYDENNRLTAVQYTALMFAVDERSEVNLLDDMELSEIDRYIVKQIGFCLLDDLYYAEENVSWTMNY